MHINIKKIIKFFTSTCIALVCLLVFVTEVNAVTMSAPYSVPERGSAAGLCWNCQYAMSGAFSGTVYKDFDMVRSDNSIVGTNFSVTVGDKFGLWDRSPRGDWHLSGGTYNNPARSGAMDWQVQERSYPSGKTYMAVAAGDGTSAVLTSSNASAVSCQGKVCTAVGAGSATITVSFPNVTLPDWSDGFYKDNNKSGFGFVQSYLQDCQYYGSQLSCYGAVNIRHAFSLPSSTYGVTVAPVPNSPHTVTYAGASAITETGATVSWTYSDPENDPQTNWQVQVATDSNFINIVANVSAPSGSDAAIRSAPVSGLSPNTFYHARVRAHNTPNTWSAWSAGTFKTLAPIACDNSRTEGQTYCDTNEEKSFSCQQGQWVATNTGNSCGTYCSTSPSQALTGSSVTFTAYPADADSFTWKLPNGTTVGSNRTYTTSYSSAGVKEMQVTVYKGVGRSTQSCTVSVTEPVCSTQRPSDHGMCVSGVAKYYTCSSNGTWTYTGVQCMQDSCPGGQPRDAQGNCPLPPCPPGQSPNPQGICVIGGGAPLRLIEYAFRPNIITDQNRTCPLYVQVENATACRLARNGSTDQITLVSTGSTVFTVAGRETNPGTYTLQCQNGAGPTFISLGTKSCFSNMQFQES